MKQLMLYGAEKQLERISKLGDPLEKIKCIINWEYFRAPLERALRKSDYSKGGRPAFDVVYMFKIIMLQQWHNVSDAQMEYMINDRLSWQRFLNMELGEKAPDEKTIWLFKEQIGATEKNAGKPSVARELFDLFNALLNEKGVITHVGEIVDATFVDVPRQRNSREENKTIKEGKVPEEWETPGNVNKLEQKDTDARWTKKGNELHYGFKDHAVVDAKSKVITEYSVTDASVHDSQVFVDLIKKYAKQFGIGFMQAIRICADAGYVGAEFEKEIHEILQNAQVSVCRRAYKNKPLTEDDKEYNREISHTRARVEHVFGYMTRFMGGLSIRTIGMARAAREIALKNLAYNLKRAAFLVASKQAVIA